MLVVPISPTDAVRAHEMVRPVPGSPLVSSDFGG